MCTDAQRGYYKKFLASHLESERARKLEYYYRHKEEILLRIRKTDAYKKECKRLRAILI